MNEHLRHLRQSINFGFDILDLILIRVLLLGLAGLSAYALLSRH